MTKSDMTCEQRILSWPGVYNTHDLGGFPTHDECETKTGAIVRSANFDRITTEGWSRVYDYGVRTVIDLRNPDERPKRRKPICRKIDVIDYALDDIDDSDFWEELRAREEFGTPLYMIPFLRKKASRSVEVLRLVANAQPGGVVIHCGAGRDRTGLISLLLLAICNVPLRFISENYKAGSRGAVALFHSAGIIDDTSNVQRRLKKRGVTTDCVIQATLACVTGENLLVQGGLSDETSHSLRQRIVSR